MMNYQQVSVKTFSLTWQFDFFDSDIHLLMISVASFINFATQWQAGH